jgi:hypothetical protein
VGLGIGSFGGFNKEFWGIDFICLESKNNRCFPVKAGFEEND